MIESGASSSVPKFMHLCFGGPTQNHYLRIVRNGARRLSRSCLYRVFNDNGVEISGSVKASARASTQQLGHVCSSMSSSQAKILNGQEANRLHFFLEATTIIVISTLALFSHVK